MSDGRWWQLDDGRFVILNIRPRGLERGEAGAEMLVVNAEGEVAAHAATPSVVVTEYLEQSAEASRPVPLTVHFAGYADPKHYWSRPIIDDRGFLWLLKADVRDPFDPTYRYEIFSPEGEYLGETTPPGWPQPSRGKVLTMWEDPESGEEYPVVYRVVMAGESK